jgi:heme oxygenase (mycobilin-producing)
MAITVVLEMQVKPEKIDDYLGVMTAALKDTRAFPGCVSVTTLQDADDPGRFVLLEQWESREADTKYREWRATPEGSLSALADMVTGRSLTYLEEKPGV